MSNKAIKYIINHILDDNIPHQIKLKKLTYMTNIYKNMLNNCYKGKSPLLWATEYGDDEIIQILQSAGAESIKISDEEKENINHQFCNYLENTHPLELENVIEYVEQGADVNCKTSKKKSPLLYAVEKNSSEVASYLIDEGADPDYTYIIPGSAFFRAQYIYPLSQAITNRNLEMVKLLIEKGASLKPTNHLAPTPLIKASEKGYLEIVEYLLNPNLEVDYRMCDYTTALESACKYKHLDTVKTLVQHGATINYENPNSSPLIRACENQDYEIVEFLLQNGANPNQSTNFFSPLSKSAEGNKDVATKIITLLHKYGADLDIETHDTTPLLSSIKKGNKKNTECLLKLGADPNKIFRYKLPLNEAIESGDNQKVKLLIQYGANVNDTSSPLTPLLKAVMSNNIEITKLLIDNNAEINNNPDYDSIIKEALAVKTNKYDEKIFRLLVECGADIYNSDAYKQATKEEKAFMQECVNQKDNKQIYNSINTSRPSFYDEDIDDDEDDNMDNNLSTFHFTKGRTR